jgi:hypothetical protein
LFYRGQNTKSDISFRDFLNKIEINPQKKDNRALDIYHFGYKAKPNLKNSNDSVIHFIDTTTIVAFEFDNVQSYTFNAVPVSDTLDIFYNIIFYQNDYGLQSKLLKYEPDFDFINSTLPFSGKIHEIDAFGNIVNTYTSSGDDNSDDQNKNIVPCTFSVSVVSVNCTGANHEPGQPCDCGTPDAPNCTPPYMYNVLDIDCNNASAGGGSSDTDNYPNENPDNPSGGGGDTTTNPNQNEDGTFNLPTDPIKPTISQEPTPEQKLKVITDNLDTRNKLYTMNINSQFVEYGLRIDRNNETDVLFARSIITDNNTDHMRIPTFHITEVIVHTHPSNIP